MTELRGDWAKIHAEHSTGPIHYQKPWLELVTVKGVSTNDPIPKALWMLYACFQSF